MGGEGCRARLLVQGKEGGPGTYLQVRVRFFHMLPLRA
jgi:hypothetical protein